MAAEILVSGTMTSPGKQGNSRIRKICFVALNAYPVFSGDYCNGSGGIGGAELQQSILGRELVKKGYDISFIIFDNGTPGTEKKEGITFIKTIERKYRFTGILSYVTAFSSVWHALKTADADAYYQRGADQLTGIVSFFCLVKRKKFVFAVTSDMDVNGVFSHSFGFFSRCLFHGGLRIADTIIVQSEYQKELVKSRFHRDAIVIKNVYLPGPATESQDKKSGVLWVSTIRPWKRPDLFLELARSLPLIKFQMIGGPAPKYESFYNKIKAEAGTIPNLEFLGLVPYTQIDRYFADSALFVNTSPYEGFPNTFLQAWANHCPVVSLSVDPDEVICTHGLGCHAKTFDRMIADVDSLMKNERQRIEFGKNGHAYVENEHDAGRIIPQYSEVFQ